MKPYQLKLFENYLKDLNMFHEDEIQLLSKKTSFRKFKKNEYFLKEGEKCHEFLFITKGIFRSFFGSTPNNLIISEFTFEGNFLTSLSSYVTGKASEESIQSIINSEALVISKVDLDPLEEKHLNWNKFLRIHSEKQFFRMEKIIRRIYKEDAETRYMNLIESHPHYFQHLPLSQIASYLGITQRHLSRIRKAIMMKEKGIRAGEKAAILL